MTKGKASSVKGFTYEFSSSSNATVFSADVKENANVWFRRYNNAAAFDASEQEYGTAASFAGHDTPTISPNSAEFDSQEGEIFSVSQIPDGTQTNSFSPPGNNVLIGLTWDGQYLWYQDFDNNTVYQLKTDGSIVSQFSSPSNNNTGMAYDGQYLWMCHNVVSGGNATIYRVKTDGTVDEKVSLWTGDAASVAWDGSYLWVSEFSSTTIGKTDTNGNQVSTINSPASTPYGVEWDGEYLWNASNGASVVYQLKTDGTEVSNFSVSSTTIRDIAWTGQYLWINDDDNDVNKQFTGSNSLDISYRYSEVT